MITPEERRKMESRFKQIFTDVVIEGTTNMGRPNANEFLDWLQTTDFFTAPASTKYHGAFDGGLLAHSLAVYDNLVHKNEQSRAIVALLHDLCKANFYKKVWKNVKVYCENGSKWDKGGKFEWEQNEGYEVEDQLPYGHGEKSVYMISQRMGLTEEEAMAIRWHMGGFDSTVRAGEFHGINQTFEKYPLAVNLHCADIRATYIDGV
jgi:hypothetical protein